MDFKRVLLLMTCAIYSSIVFTQNCAEKLILKQSEFDSIPIAPIPKFKPSNLNIPLFFTSKQVEKILDSLIPENIVEEKQKTSFKFDIKDSHGKPVGSREIKRVEFGYGIFKPNSSKCIAENNKLLINIPLEFYSYLEIEMSTIESFVTLGQFYSELLRLAPELLGELSHNIGLELKRFGNRNIKNEDLRKAYNQIVDYAVKIVDLGITAVQFGTDIGIAGIVHAQNMIDNTYRGLEAFSKGDIAGVKDSFDGMLSSSNDLLGYIDKRLGVTSSLQNTFDPITNTTFNLLNESTKAIDKTFEGIKKGGKEVEKVIKNIGKEVERGWKRVFGYNFQPLNYDKYLLASSDNTHFEILPRYPFASIRLENPIDEIENAFKSAMGQKYILSCGRKGNRAKIDLSLDLSLIIDNRFNIEIDQKINLDWRNGCGFLRLLVSPEEMDKKINLKSQEIVNKFVDKLENKIELRNKIIKIWDIAQEERVYSTKIKNEKAYIRYNPSHIAIEGLNSARDTTFMNIQIQATPEISFFKPFETNPDFKPFPNENRLNPNFDKGFNLNFTIDVAYQKLIDSAKERLKQRNRKIDFTLKVLKRNKLKIKKLKVKDFKIYTKGNKIVFGFCCRGYIKGLIFIEAIPVYNKYRGIIDLENLKWSDETIKNFSLLNIEDRVISLDIKNELENIMRFSLANQIKPKISSLRDEYFVNDSGLIINGKLISISLTTIQPIPDMLKVYVQINAELSGVTMK